MNSSDVAAKTVVVVGAGPAGLRAAEVAAARGARVVLCDAQPFRRGENFSSQDAAD